MKSAFYVLIATLSVQAWGDQRLIGGKVVPKSWYPAVVMLDLGDGSCTGTLVGPEVLITAAHCADSGYARFGINNEVYEVELTQSPHYDADYRFREPDADTRVNVDLALGVVSKPVKGVEPVSMAGAPKVGTAITLLGYGCTNTEGEGGNDGKLRRGRNRVAEYRGSGYIANDESLTAAGCYGDSGGPVLDDSGRIVGVHSQANIEDTTWEIRLDTKQAVSFIKKFIKAHQVTICGVNASC
jgi:V8-like Glu-specific endopeptidase